MSAVLLPVVAESIGSRDPLERDHIVCHCTSQRIGWCGLDLTTAPWVDEVEGLDCPLCGLLEEEDRCPWGCACEECGA